MKIFTFESLPMYGGAEYIPVLAVTEKQAYEILLDYLKKQGRETERKVLDWRYPGQDKCPDKPTVKTFPAETRGGISGIEYFETGEVLYWTMICSQEMPEGPCVLEELIHAFWE